jgi:hypothetical protein
MVLAVDPAIDRSAFSAMYWIWSIAVHILLPLAFICGTVWLAAILLDRRKYNPKS